MCFNGFDNVLTLNQTHMVELVKFDVPAISLISSSTWVDAVIGVWHTLLSSFWFGASHKLLAVLADSSKKFYTRVWLLQYPSATKRWSPKDAVCVRLASGCEAGGGVLAQGAWSLSLHRDFDVRCWHPHLPVWRHEGSIGILRHWGWRSFPFWHLYNLYILIWPILIELVPLPEVLPPSQSCHLTGRLVL